MADEFTHQVAQKFPNTLNMSRDPVERPWDVTEPGEMTSIRRFGDEYRRDDLAERINTLYSELRASLTIRSALEFDLKKATRLLDEVSRMKAEIERVVEMLQVMEEYMKERIK
jgi:hypothetical protein